MSKYEEMIMLAWLIVTDAQNCFDPRKGDATRLADLVLDLAAEGKIQP